MSPSSANSLPDRDYRRALTGAVQRALSGGTPGLRDLLGAVEGADPPGVVEVLQLIATSNGQLGASAHVALAEAMSAVPDGATAPPVPHPLDCAWMFTERTQRQLLQHLAEMTTPGQTIVHLGTPTLHRTALQSLNDRRHILFDRDARVVEQANTLAPGSAQTIDLLDRTPATRDAAAAVADPPWYPRPAIAFTRAASAVLRADAELLLAFPAELTRPGIRKDRAELLDGSARDGMTLLSADSGALRYETPAFERAAMNARGLSGTPADWRLGDLLRLRRTSAPLRSTLARHTEEWVAFEIDEIPLRSRPAAPPGGSQLIGQLVPGDVLPTVSGRAPERERAAIWTSRNRVYQSADPAALTTLLHHLAHEIPLPSDQELAAAARKLIEIVSLERREHGLGAPDAEVAQL